MKTKVILGIINILFGLLLLPSIFVAMMSVMIFDAPGSQNSLLTWMFFWSIVSFPILCVVSFIFTWIFYTKEKKTLAYIASFLPLLSVVSGIFCVFLLQTLCEGSFVCS